MARRKNVTPVDDYDTRDHYFYLTCKECGEKVDSRDQGLYKHRSEMHDKARGITSHVQYYPGMLFGQAQIVLTDPYTVSVELQREGSKMNEPAIYISASDKNMDNPERDCTLYLRISEARKLAIKILQECEKV